MYDSLFSIVGPGDAAYDSYYQGVLVNLCAAGLPHPEESVKEITDVIFGLVATYSVEDLRSVVVYE